MKIKTSELSGAALDWVVCVCEYDNLACRNIQYPQFAKHYPKVSPSTDWAQGGLIIEREGIAIDRDSGVWVASLNDQPVCFADTSPLIAAMRCYVASKLGDMVDVPDELAS